jgi:hypothetical protein
VRLEILSPLEESVRAVQVFVDFNLEVAIDKWVTILGVLALMEVRVQLGCIGGLWSAAADSFSRVDQDNVLEVSVSLPYYHVPGHVKFGFSVGVSADAILSKFGCPNLANTRGVGAALGTELESASVVLAYPDSIEPLSSGQAPRIASLSAKRRLDLLNLGLFSLEGLDVSISNEVTDPTVNKEGGSMSRCRRTCVHYASNLALIARWHRRWAHRD